MLKVIRASQGARNSENNKIQKVISKRVLILQKAIQRPEPTVKEKKPPTDRSFNTGPT
jgi:hypothetical protein